MHNKNQKSEKQPKKKINNLNLLKNKNHVLKKNHIWIKKKKRKKKRTHTHTPTQKKAKKKEAYWTSCLVNQKKMKKEKKK